MKAVQISEYGSPDVLTVTELPTPAPGPGELLIKVEAAGVNFSDVIRRRNDPYPDPTPLPFVLGGEAAGVVVDAGPEADTALIGTTVFGLVGRFGEGGYAEYVTINAANAIPVPPGMTSASAAALTVTGLSALVLLREAAHLTAGETVFIPAASGGFGSFAVQIAKRLGATVIAGVGSVEKRQAVLSNGADAVMDYRVSTWVEEVRALTDGRGADVVLEMVGPAHVAESLEALAPFGRLVTYGAVAGRQSALPDHALDTLLYDPAPGQILTGFNLGEWFARKTPLVIGALQDVITWAADGSLRTPPVVEFPLEDAAEAHRQLEAGTTSGKIVLRP